MATTFGKFQASNHVATLQADVRQNQWVRCKLRQAVYGLAMVVLAVSAGNAAAEESNAEQRQQVRLPKTPYDYTQASLPKYVRKHAAMYDNTPADNPITNHGATLGRVLFYDRQLSRNGTTSCASCHQQKLAFTDGKKVSVGFDRKAVTRNSMSLLNLRYYRRGKMFWDERAASLEAQVLMPIENKVEMGHRLPELTRQLQADPLYPPLFAAAFGSPQVTSERMARSLAQFIRALVAFRSKYDVGRDQVATVHDAFPNFSKQENYGKELFLGRARCAECHLEPQPGVPLDSAARQSAFFFIAKPTVNGVDSDVPKVDLGVAAATQRREDQGRFKVSSLRNILLTGPYMHDGRFITIEQVVEHYNWSVRPHPNLDPRLADFAANGLALPETEKVALIEFLGTLTDRQILSDPRFSDPFVRPPSPVESE